MSNYAAADRTTQWFAGKYPGAKIEPNVGVVHTTETYVWPGYAGGATAPNVTAMPNFRRKRLDFRAHFPDEMSSRALRNEEGGVETNTLNAHQIELVGTCDPRTHQRWLYEGREHIYWNDPPEWALRDLADYVLDMHLRHGIKLQTTRFVDYPASYGKFNPNRFSFAEWRGFYGWCGHQHVPENTHGDPGGIPMKRVVELAIEKKGGGIVTDDSEYIEWRFQHSSLQFSDDPWMHEHDADMIFSKGSNVVSWTEATSKTGLREKVIEAGEKAGYEVFAHWSGVGIAVRKDWGKIKRKGWKPVIPGKAGDHPTRGLAWVKIETHEKPREKVFYGASHYLHKSRKPGSYRWRRNRDLAEVISRWAQRKGKGRNLVFHAADYNMNDKKSDVYFGGPLTTCWDELGKWPNTGHGPIDAIASYDNDGRVKCINARRIKGRVDKFHLFSDHFTVIAKYRVKV